MIKWLKRPIAFISAIAVAVGMVSDVGTMQVSAEETSTTASVAFSALDGAPEGYSDETYSNLLDGTASTKWCCSFTNPSYVIFKASQPIYVDGYSVWTANDSSEENGARNPVAWTLSACNDYDETNKTGGTWQIIHGVEVTEDNSEDALPAENLAEKKYSFTQTTDCYRYFKLNITSIKSRNTMQLGDFALSYTALTCEEHRWVVNNTIEPTCTKGGYTEETCSTCGQVRQSNPTDALWHDFVSEQCTRCGKNMATAETPSVTAYATSEQLKVANNFTLHTENGTGVAQKVNFGTNGTPAQTWYIAGYEDGTESLVMMCDPKKPFATDKVFKLDRNNTTSGIQGTYTDTAPTEVFANHYGCSVLRAYLTADALNNFSESEKTLMQNATVYTNDTKNGKTYSTEDKLYAAYGNYKDKYITVGTNAADNLSTGIKIGLSSSNGTAGSPYDESEIIFWLRTPKSDLNEAALYAKTGDDSWKKYVGSASVFPSKYIVVPAFHLNMRSVLFASSAPAGTSDVSLSDAMTFRYNGTDKVTSTAVYEANGVKVTKGGDNEYLYIQWKEDGTDQVYSKQITSDMNISRGSLGVDSFENCKIWIEKVEDNIAYAVEATKGHDYSAQIISDNAKISDATCTEKAKYYYSCSVCGEVEKNAEHVFEDVELAEHTDAELNGKCDVCGNDFKTFKQLGKLIIKVNQNLSDGKYAEEQYTTASIDNLRKALVAANAITAESSETAVTEAYDNLLAASTVGAGGLIKADRNIVIAFADTGSVRGIAAGNGWYANGEKVTLKVTPSVGYTFSKWTSDTAGNTSVGTESTYTFTLAEDSLDTYYAWLNEVKYTVTCGSVEGGTCSTDAEGGKYVYGQTATVTATADANYEFAGWKDSYGSTVSTDAVYSFAVIGNTTLTPEFVKVKTDEGADITYVTVSFYHQSGKLLDSQKVVSGEGQITTTVNAPTKAGFDFLGWSAKASGATAEDVVDFNTATFSEDTSLYPVFKAQDITYTLTINGQSESKAPQSKVTVTADPIDGQQFVGWKNSDGNIVSYDSTYTFIITGDTTLTSYYEPVNAVIEKTPTINMSAPVYEDINDNGKSYYKMTFYFDYTLPEDCKLIDIGTIKVKGEDLSSDGITLDTENVSQYSVLSKLGVDGQFYYSKSNYYRTGHTVAGYMIYEKSGIRYTVYSNAAYGIKEN